jgi:hypothetical protein
VEPTAAGSTACMLTASDQYMTWALQAAQPQVAAAARLVFSLVRAQLARPDPKPAVKKRTAAPQAKASKAATQQVFWHCVLTTRCRYVCRAPTSV